MQLFCIFIQILCNNYHQKSVKKEVRNPILLFLHNTTHCVGYLQTAMINKLINALLTGWTIIIIIFFKSSASFQNRTAHVPAPIRMRVRVQDNVFLIPVPHRSDAGFVCISVWCVLSVCNCRCCFCVCAVRQTPVRWRGCVSKPLSATIRCVVYCHVCPCRKRALCSYPQIHCWLCCTPMKRSEVVWKLLWTVFWCLWVIVF